MKPWNAFTFGSVLLVLAACAAHPPQQFSSHESLEDSWEAWYVETQADSGL